jgi:hypothetical protein
MDFQKFIGQPNSEVAIVTEIANYLRVNYDAYHGRNYFLKFEKVDAERSKIAWVKAFATREAFDDFYYDTKFQRAMVAVFTCRDFLAIVCFGFFASISLDVYKNKIRTMSAEAAEGNIEDERMFGNDPAVRKMLDEGFADLFSMLASDKKSGAA